MRAPLIVGNWKMHKTIKEAVEFVNHLSARLKGVEGKRIVVAPSFTSLAAVAEVLADTHIGLAAQNVSDSDEGALTGEVSARMLVDAGCRYVIVGHSERRSLFGEEDSLINRKLKASLKQGLQPILCVGETLEEREADLTFEVIKRQLETGVAGIGADQARELIVAYEPKWAIGTGKTASPEQATEVHACIRKVVDEIYRESLRYSLPVLYGGSVKPDNIKSLMSQPDINGVLVGGASLDIESFAKIVEF